MTSARFLLAGCALLSSPALAQQPTDIIPPDLAVQYKDFDSDPAFAMNARGLEDAFLRSLGYASKQSHVAQRDLLATDPSGVGDT